MRKHGIPPRPIELELPEGIIMRDGEKTIKILGKLHDKGFRLSIDGFGTGFSSLNYFRRWSFVSLK